MHYPTIRSSRRRSSRSCSSVRPPWRPAQGFGIKVGPTFDEFSGDALDFDTRTGIHAGLFVGGSRDNVFGFQTEFNWLRKNAEPNGVAAHPDRLPADPGAAAPQCRLQLRQRPCALRHRRAGDRVEDCRRDRRLYAGRRVRGADVSLLFGGGFEVARIIIEGRYEKGLATHQQQLQQSP